MSVIAEVRVSDWEWMSVGVVTNYRNLSVCVCVCVPNRLQRRFLNVVISLKPWCQPTEHSLPLTLSAAVCLLSCLCKNPPIFLFFLKPIQLKRCAVSVRVCLHPRSRITNLGVEHRADDDAHHSYRFLVLWGFYVETWRFWAIAV